MRANEKTAIQEIVGISQVVNYGHRAELEKAAASAKKNKLMQNTVFGNRYIERLQNMLRGEKYEHVCILCENPTMEVVCPTCMEQLRPVVEERKEYVRKTRLAQSQKQMQQQGNRANASEPTIAEATIAEATTSQAGQQLMEELVRNMDSSMDKLANQRTVRRIYHMVYAILCLCAVNTIAIVWLLFYLKSAL